MIENFIIGVLTMLLLGQQVYWSRIVHSLMDKLMSRDYQNYAEVKKFLKNKPTHFEAPSDDAASDPVAEQHAQELNTIMGMV